ncbi:MAG: hypothetical protein IPG96_19390 [Proteobacteria bacterium]|jgi:hypothetical protein|nr:hypothetical protein [Pseudomonadota bacterium]
MTDKASFTKYEHQVLPGFRHRLSHAESSEDVKQSFSFTAQELLDKVLAGRLPVSQADVALTPDAAPFFVLGERLSADAELASICAGSDLPNVLGRLAEAAVHRYRHVERHPEKTNSKIRG